MKPATLPQKWTQNDSDDSSESPEIQSSDCRVTQLATEKGISIALVQEPYVGNQGILKQNPGTKVIQCTVGRQKPVKAAIIVFGDKVENEAGYHLDLLRRRRGHRAIYHQNEKSLQKSGNRKSDHSWRHKCVEPLVGKPERRQEGPSSEISWTKWASTLNTGSTPTFETYRAIESAVVVDVTACSSPLIGRVENGEWTERQQHRTTTRSCSTCV
ncbi:hypothetical protein EVAR_85957_1 [Eumeta japonica]|uniref:Uncharacterized protein n=1 Tax=Eumeta variegata TaxID=151549 RepID=A0A4C1UJ54_EUMVA|nr:hypothetical protein EVAR_85957_1 [Eumeta japonica]